MEVNHAGIRITKHLSFYLVATDVFYQKSTNLISPSSFLSPFYSFLPIFFVVWRWQFGTLKTKPQLSLFCRWDYLRVSNDNYQIFGKYCGQETGRTVTVTAGEYAVIKFHSDYSGQTRGFLLSFNASLPGKFSMSIVWYLKMKTRYKRASRILLFAKLLLQQL